MRQWMDFCELLVIVCYIEILLVFNALWSESPSFNENIFKFNTWDDDMFYVNLY